MNLQKTNENEKVFVTIYKNMIFFFLYIFILKNNYLLYNIYQITKKKCDVYVLGSKARVKLVILVMPIEHKNEKI